MRCTRIDLGGGVTGFVCRDGRHEKPKPCSACRNPSAFQCDHEVESGKTCDVFLCAACAREAGEDRHLCPRHARAVAGVVDALAPVLLGPIARDALSPLVPHPVPHPPGCPRCDAGLCHGCRACRGERAHRIGPRRIPGFWVGVVGARGHANGRQIDEAIDALPLKTVVVSGGAAGVDSRAVERARARGMATVVLEANWRRLGRRAGPIRNGEIVACVDGLVAAPWWGAVGTYDCMRQAQAAAVPIRELKPLAAQLEVFTTRLSPALRDPDVLDITLATATAHHAALGREWATMRPAERVAAFVKWAREKERAGASLADLGRLARAEGAPSPGALWAPTAKLLHAGKAGLDEAERIRERADLDLARRSASGEPAPEAVSWHEGEQARARNVEEEAWGTYTAGFRELLVERYRAFPAWWGWVLGKRRIVLACMCPRPKHAGPEWARCHRFLVARAVEKLGARYGGEIGSGEGGQGSLW